MESKVITAVITPLKNGRVDHEGLRQNLLFQMESGVDGLLVLGSTGEGATLSDEERRGVIETAAEIKKIPLMVNVGDVSTEKTIQKALEAESLGADLLLVIAPYYCRPSEEGLARHFETVAKSTRLPILLYNHPKRAGIEISLKTVLRLSTIKNIIGIKDASGSIPYVASIKHALPKFELYAGDDLLFLPYQAVGAGGVISVLSNLLPNEMVHLNQENFPKLFPLMEASQIETNPVPIKAMMNLSGMAAGEVRAPLAPLSQENKEKIEALMGAYV